MCARVIFGETNICSLSLSRHLGRGPFGALDREFPRAVLYVGRDTFVRRRELRCRYYSEARGVCIRTVFIGPEYRERVWEEDSPLAYTVCVRVVY